MLSQMWRCRKFWALTSYFNLTVKFVIVALIKNQLEMSFAPEPSGTSKLYFKTNIMQIVDKNYLLSNFDIISNNSKIRMMHTEAEAISMFWKDSRKLIAISMEFTGFHPRTKSFLLFWWNQNISSCNTTITFQMLKYNTNH